MKKLINIFPWEYYFVNLFSQCFSPTIPFSLIYFYRNRRMNIYYPVAITRTFTQLMVNFCWPRIPWRLVKKDGSFVNRDEQKKRKLLQRSHHNKPLQRSHYQMTSFFLFFNSSLFVSRESSNNLVSLVRLEYFLAINTITDFFFDPYREYCPRSSHRLWKLFL